MKIYNKDQTHSDVICMINDSNMTSCLKGLSIDFTHVHISIYERHGEQLNLENVPSRLWP